MSKNHLFFASGFISRPLLKYEQLAPVPDVGISQKPERLVLEQGLRDSFGTPPP